MEEAEVSDVQCCVPFCETKSRKVRSISFFTFPVEDSVKRQWISAIEGMGNAASDALEHNEATAHICSRHFTEDDFMKQSSPEKGRLIKRSLNKGAIPSLFMGNKLRPKPNREKKNVATTPSSKPVGHDPIIDVKTIAEKIIMSKPETSRSPNKYVVPQMIRSIKDSRTTLKKRTSWKLGNRLKGSALKNTSLSFSPTPSSNDEQLKIDDVTKRMTAVVNSLHESKALNQRVFNTSRQTRKSKSLVVVRELVVQQGTETRLKRQQKTNALTNKKTLPRVPIRIRKFNKPSATKSPVKVPTPASKSDSTLQSLVVAKLEEDNVSDYSQEAKSGPSVVSECNLDRQKPGFIKSMLSAAVSKVLSTPTTSSRGRRKSTTPKLADTVKRSRRPGNTTSKRIKLDEFFDEDDDQEFVEGEAPWEIDDEEDESSSSYNTSAEHDKRLKGGESGTLGEVMTDHSTSAGSMIVPDHKVFVMAVENGGEENHHAVADPLELHQSSELGTTARYRTPLFNSFDLQATEPDSNETGSGVPHGSVCEPQASSCLNESDANLNLGCNIKMEVIECKNENDNTTNGDGEAQGVDFSCDYPATIIKVENENDFPDSLVLVIPDSNIKVETTDE